MNVVISGASKGIGKAIAEKFASENHTLFICSRTLQTLQQTADELKNKYPGCRVLYQAVDLSKKTGAEEFGNWIKGQCTPDILINNAGTFLPGSIYNEPEGTLETMISNNLYSAYWLTRSLVPKMIQRGSGHIFNMCSTASIAAYSNGGSYSISKYALAGFSKNLRQELKPHHIKVTAIYPGATYTDSWRNSGLPESRFMSIGDIAALVYTTVMLSPQACVEELLVRPIEGDI